MMVIMWPVRSFVALAVFGACALGTEPARAQASPEHAGAVADFQEGTKLADDGDCPAAILKFQESLKKEEGVGAHLNLADCYEKTGAVVKAWREFKVAERFATTKRNDERRELAHNRAYGLEAKVFRLTLNVPLVDGLAVRINGEPIDRDLIAAGIVAIDPGPYKIEASATKRKSVTQSGSGLAGEIHTVTLTFEDVVEAAPPVEAPPVASPSPRRTVGLAVGGAGIVALGVGSVFGLVTLGKKDDIKQAASAPTNADYNAARSDAHSSGLLSTIFFIGGGVVLAAGAALYLTAPSSTSSKSARVSVAPAVGPTARGLAVLGEW